MNGDGGTHEPCASRSCKVCNISPTAADILALAGVAGGNLSLDLTLRQLESANGDISRISFQTISRWDSFVRRVTAALKSSSPVHSGLLHWDGSWLIYGDKTRLLGTVPTRGMLLDVHKVLPVLLSMALDSVLSQKLMTSEILSMIPAGDEDPDEIPF
jgi:hypothetical protein